MLFLTTETNVNFPINIFTLPNGKAINTFSLVDSFEFLMISQNIINSFLEKKTLLEKAATQLSEKLENTGVVNKKEKPRLINNKILNLYVTSWEKRMSDFEYFLNKSPYSTDFKSMQFMAKYNSRYKKSNLLEQIRTDEVIYSCMNDPIEGGIFSQTLYSDPSICLCEKSLLNNSQGLMYYSLAYKYFKEEKYKDIAISTFNFIKNHLRSEKGGYINLITINCDIPNTKYYKYSIEEIKTNFKEKWILIAKALGLNPNLNHSDYQEIKNTTSTKYLSKEDLSILSKIRYSRDERLLDTRVISGYNFALATALCIFSRCLPEFTTQAINIAEDVINFFTSKLKQNETSIFRYITQDDQIVKQADLYDNACFLNSIIELYKFTKKEKYAQLIKKYTKYIIKHYYQPENGMFLKTPKNIR